METDWAGMAAFVTSLAGLVTVIGLQIKTIMSQHAAKKRGEARDEHLVEIKEAVNGTSEKLNKVTGQEAFARGRAEGVIEGEHNRG